MLSEACDLRLRRRGPVIWLATSLLWSAMAACHSSGGRPSAVAVSTPDSGSLPTGCSVVATLDPAVSTRLGGALDAALATHIANVSTFGGVDFRRDVHRVRYCQIDWDTSHPRFLLLLSGDISPGVLEAVAARSERHWARERIGDSPVVSQGNFWAAHRGATSRGGELLLANDHELLRRALLNPSGSYPLEASMPFSAVISVGALGRAKRRASAGQLSALDSVQELRLSVPPDGRSLTVRAIVANREASEPLSQAIGPVLSAIAKKLSKPGEPELKVVAENRGGDVVARMELSDGTLNTLIAGLSTRASRL